MKYSRAEFSRICGISKAAVTKSVKAGRLAVDSDGKIDTHNRLNSEYFQAHQVETEFNQSTESPTKDFRKKIVPSKPGAKQKKDEELPPEFSGLTISDLYDDSKFQGFSFSLLEKREKILQIRTRRQKIEIEVQLRRGDLIEKKFVMGIIESYLSGLSDQLFDYADTDKKMRKDFSKLIKHAQRLTDHQLQQIHMEEETKNENKNT